MSTDSHAGVLLSEQEHFDLEALSLGDDELRIQDDQIARYRNARPGRAQNTAKDALFASLLPVDGKRVLDYGCGTGDIACEMALCGARVTAFDLSPLSVEKARRRAELHGVAGGMSFDVREAGQTGYPAASFDVVVGAAILHHLHTELPTIFRELDRILTPGGTACFIEPVANSPVLRGLRRLIPIKSDITPDERQLFYRDFEPLRACFPRLDFHHFYCLERLKRVVGDWASAPLRSVDHYAQRLLPLLKRYYGTVLVVARR